MTPLVAGLLAAAAAAAVVDWVAVWRGGATGRRVERVAKPLAMLALIAAAVAWPVAPGGGDPLLRALLVAGLVASLTGDVLLLPPGRFVPGLLAFLAAHLAYLAAFMLVGSAAGWWLAAGLLAGAILAATVGRVIVRSARRVGLGVPVAAYLGVIMLMAVAATRTGEIAAIAGAWLFVASDALLGWGRFREPAAGVPRGGGRVLGTAVMVTYHAAQAMIVVALAA